MNSFPVRFLKRAAGLAATLAVVALAVVLCLALWDRYMIDPWTRDGRVRVETVTVAPEVSGTVTNVPVEDNQFVHKGDLLFEIDPERFEIALAQAQATAEARRQQMLLQQANAARRTGLTNLSVSAEEKLQYVTGAAAAEAAYREATTAIDLAKLNLARARVHSPVDGYVTNLRLRVGDYATEGRQAISVIDSNSFWIVGYFEETKLARVGLGDKASIRMMGYEPLVSGHVESISRGISDTNGQADAVGLPNVNPVFTWVRLAQRIPVRIHIDQVPDGIVLAAGTTCSISVDHPESARKKSGPAQWADRLLSRLTE